MKAKRKSRPGLWAALGIVFMAAALLAFPEQIKEGAGNSILTCLTTLVPSLFPFMVLASLAAEPGVSDAVGRYLGFLPRYVFRLPAACAAPILLSFVGGYPAGAKGVSLLLEQGKITEKQAARMMLFCVAPGMAFVVTFLGGAVLRSVRAGWILFAAVTFSGVLLGFFLGLGRPVPEKEAPCAASPAPGALTRSVFGASKSVAVMCGYIVLFGAFLSAFKALGLFHAAALGLSKLLPFSQDELSALLSFLFEVTDGVGEASAIQAGPCLYAFGLAFGGLCVHMQVFSCFGRFPGKKPAFFGSRLLHSLLSAGAAAALIRLLPGKPVEVIAPAGTVSAVLPLSGTWAGGLSLLLMCLAFLIVTGKEEPDASRSLPEG